MESHGYALLEITNKVMHYHPPAGYIYRVLVIVMASTTGYQYDMQVLFSSIKDVEIETDRDLF